LSGPPAGTSSLYSGWQDQAFAASAGILTGKAQVADVAVMMIVDDAEIWPGRQLDDPSARLFQIQRRTRVGRVGAGGENGLGAAA
jgi:hypothetical protein